MVYIDLQSNPPDADWITKAEELTNQLIEAKNANDEAALKKIIDDNSKHWGAIKEHLEKLSFGKCWYSEAREVFSYYHVDHFRPKGACVDLDGNKTDGYWWLAFNWANYRLCGGVGNVVKREKFAVRTNKVSSPENPVSDEVIYLLDPTVKSDPKKLAFNEDGSITPANPNKNHFDNKRAAYTIEVLNLYFDKLQTERRRAWRKCAQKIKETNDLIGKNNDTPSAVLQTLIDTNENWFREHLVPCVEFSSVYKNCLKKCGEDWALELLAENLSINNWCKDYLEED